MKNLEKWLGRQGGRERSTRDNLAGRKEMDGGKSKPVNCHSKVWKIQIKAVNMNGIISKQEIRRTGNE